MYQTGTPKNSRVAKIEFDGTTNKVNYTYDNLGRIVTRTVNDGSERLSTTYGYVAGGYPDANTGVNNSTTPLVESITQEGASFQYAYDDCGNIVSETSGSDTKTYEYDALGQLIRVNDPTDPTGGNTGTTWVYTLGRQL